MYPHQTSQFVRILKVSLTITGTHFFVQGGPGARGFPGADGSAGPKVSPQKIQNILFKLAIKQKMCAKFVYDISCSYPIVHQRYIVIMINATLPDLYNRVPLVSVEALELLDLRVPLVSLAAMVNLVCQDPR